MKIAALFILLLSSVLFLSPSMARAGENQTFVMKVPDLNSATQADAFVQRAKTKEVVISVTADADKKTLSFVVTDQFTEQDVMEIVKAFGLTPTLPQRTN